MKLGIFVIASLLALTPLTPAQGQKRVFVSPSEGQIEIIITPSRNRTSNSGHRRYQPRYNHYPSRTRVYYPHSRRTGVYYRSPGYRNIPTRTRQRRIYYPYRR